MPLAPAEAEPLLRLCLVPGIGAHRLALLMERFGSAEGALGARARELAALGGIGHELARRILAAARPAAAAETRRARRALERLDALVLTRADPVYPPALCALPDPPYVLFAAGALEVLAEPSLAVVGTRAPTRYGRTVARELSRDLALAGYVIVSGMARGIDTAAHEGALAAEGHTLGVLGNGIEQVYPPENGRLYARVRESGLLLTEYPPGETPRAGNFPRRNRLITALSDAVLVVEMGHRSGAQHSVSYALAQGREVLAVPGPIDSPPSGGTNQLIKDGARMVTGADDVLEELRGVGSASSSTGRGTPRAGWGGPEPSAIGARGARGVAVSADRRGGPGVTSRKPASPRLSPEHERLLGTLTGGPVHLDTLVEAGAGAPGHLLSVLLELELRGLVEALPGKRFRRLP